MITIHELKELLSHVHIKKLEHATQNLKELAESSNVKPIPDQAEVNLVKARDWQNGLLKVLQEKFRWKSFRTFKRCLTIVVLPAPDGAVKITSLLLFIQKSQV